VENSAVYTRGINTMSRLLDYIVELIVRIAISTAIAIGFAAIYELIDTPGVPMDFRLRIALDNVVIMYNIANEIDSTAIELALAIVSTIITTITIFLLPINGRSRE